MLSSRSSAAPAAVAESTIVMPRSTSKTSPRLGYFTRPLPADRTGSASKIFDADHLSAKYDIEPGKQEINLRPRQLGDALRQHRFVERDHLRHVCHRVFRKTGTP